MTETIILIPALDPGERLLTIIDELKAAGLNKIILVDDGSDEDHKPIFSEAEKRGCDVISYEANLGKGVALKTGFRAAVDTYGRDICVITADSDGQHKVSDIVKVGQATCLNPDKLVLGVRDFTGEDVPGKSRFGNTLTTKLFKITSGVNCPDTQTGLRGIPSGLLDLAIKTEGSRYEYEMNFLSATVKRAELYYVPIETIYEDNNSVSHFRPVRDSIRVYGMFFRFLLSSLSGFAVDYIAYAFLIGLLPGMGFGDQGQVIIIATVLARILSGTVNFLMNKTLAFKSKGNTMKESLRYLILFFCQMGTSALLVAGLSMVLPAMVSKITVDSVLFFISFVIQKRWVFGSGKPKADRAEILII